MKYLISAAACFTVMMVAFALILSRGGVERVFSGLDISKQLAQVAPTQGLVAAYSFDEGGGFSAGDSVGGNTGTLQGGVSWTSGKIGSGAILLDGSTGSVSFGNVSAANFGTADFGVSMWLKLSPGSNHAYILSKRIACDVGSFYNFSASSAGSAGLEVEQDANNYITFYGSRNIRDSQWHHYVATRNGSTITIYIDGTQEASQSGIPSPANLSNSANLTLAANPCAASLFGGAVDDLRIYNRGLSSADVQSLYNLGTAAVVQPPPGNTATVPLVSFPTFQAESGLIEAPFAIQGAGIVQTSQTDNVTGGLARYRFSVPTSGQYVVKAMLNAPSDANNSLYVNIDSDPAADQIWHITPTSGTEERIMSWGGDTGGNNPQKIYSLASGEHLLYVRGREPNVSIDQFTLAAPVAQNLQTTFILSVTKSGTGAGTVSGGAINCGTTCSATLNSSTQVTLTASPASGSTFTGWGGACSGTGSCTVTLSSSLTVSASFATAQINPPPTGARAYYIDWDNGNDGSAGSKANPWKRAPYMNGFSGTYNHNAGDQFIFKGGVTWPISAFQMKITQGGNSESARDYYGVDQTWYTGSSWRRPIFNFQNIQLGFGWMTSAGILLENVRFITFDNLELMNHRAPLNPATGADAGAATIVFTGTTASITVQNSFIHDWSIPTPIPGSDGGGGGGIHSIGISGGGGSGIKILNNVFTQSGISTKSGTPLWLWAEIAYNDIYQTATGMLGGGNIHDNHVHDFVNFTDPLAHPNAIYTHAPSVVYNNRVHDITSGSSAIYLAPGFIAGNSGVDLVYNNIVYNIGIQAPIQIDTEGTGNPGVVGSRVYNNILKQDGNCVRVAYRAVGRDLGSLDLRNNLCISTISSPFCYNNIGGGCAPVKTLTATNNLVMTPSQATAAGYSPNNYYATPSGSSAVINAGVSLASAFSTDFLGTSRPQGGAWDIGAYEYTGVVTPPQTSSYTLTVNKAGSGLGTVSGATINCGSACSATMNNGTPITLTATANSGSSFTGWSGACSGTGVCSLTITGNTSVTATFGTNQVVSPPPVVVTVPTMSSLNFEAEAGLIETPFATSVSGGATVISQPTQIVDTISSGRARWKFNIPSAGNYVVKIRVNAASTASDSLYVSVDNEPTEPATVWDIVPITSGIAERTVSWRGSGTSVANEFNPKVFNLSAGEHTLIIRGREANVLIDSISVASYSLPSVPASTKFAIGARVQTTATLNVRSLPSLIGLLLGTQPTGALGTVLESAVAADGYQWWRINYDSDFDGWSVEDYLTSYSTPVVSPPPAGDTQPPTIPTGLGATVVSSSQVNLSWNASSDNVGVAGYRIYRNGILVTTVNSGTTYSNSGLAASTAYTFSVSAVDAAGNASAQSASVPATTQAPLDTIAPLISLVGTSLITANSANISWTTNEAADTQVEYGLTTAYGSFTALVSTLSTTHTTSLISLSPGTTYHYRVRSRDAAGNTSFSTDQTVTTLATPPVTDLTPPSRGTVNVTNLTATGATLSWTTNEPATSKIDYGPTTSYGQVSSLATLSTAPVANLSGLNRKTTYHYRISSTDSSGNTSISADSTFITQSRLAKPLPIANLSATAGSVILSWSNPDYEYLRNIVIVRRTDSFSQTIGGGTTVANLVAPMSTWKDSSVSDGITYYYSVFTTDDLGNISDPVFISFTPASPASSGNNSNTSNPGNPGNGGNTNSGSGNTGAGSLPTGGGGLPTNIPSGNGGVSLTETNQVRTTTNLNIRSSPTTAAGISLKVVPGTIMTVLGGPVAANGYNWIQVRLGNGAIGWAADSYVTRIVSTAAPTGSTGGGGVQSTSSLPQVRTTLKLNIRKSAGTGAAIVTIAPTNTILTVIGGPVAASGYNWLEVRFANGTTGWGADAYLSKLGTAVVTTPAAGGTPSSIILKEGDRFETISAVNVRSLPSTGSAIRVTARMKVKGTIVSGPVSASGYSWYQVKLDTGTTGWMAAAFINKI